MWYPAPFGTPKAQRPSPILLVEVSDRTYKKDSGIKLRKSAKAGVREYWIVNVSASRVEVYRGQLDPTGRLADCRYADVRHALPGDSIALLLRPEVTIAVGDCLP